MSDYYDDIEFKDTGRVRKVRKKKHYLARFLIFVAVVAGIGAFLASPFFDVASIEVEGNTYYSDKEVIHMSDAETGVNIFWGLGAGSIKDRLEEDPYFSEVKVSRKLPSTMVIEVEERGQIAAIVYGDKYIVIDKSGTVLRKSDVDPKVTLITGLTISRLDVGQAVEAEESATLTSTLNMLDSMSNGNIYFKRIDVSGVTISAYIYDTLIVKGTPRQMTSVIDSGNLQKVVNNLFENDTTRGTIKIGSEDYMSFSPEF